MQLHREVLFAADSFWFVWLLAVVAPVVEETILVEQMAEGY